MMTSRLRSAPGWARLFALAGIVLAAALPAAAVSLPVSFHYVPPAPHSMVRNRAIQPITPVVDNGTPEMTYDVTAGHIPAGLGLFVHTGVIEGTPTESGEFNMTVTVRTSDGREATTQVRLVVE